MSHPPDDKNAHPKNVKARSTTSSTSTVLDDLVREAKEDPAPRTSISEARFASMEDAIVARMASEQERSPLVEEVAASSSVGRGSRSRARVFQIGAMVLAAAAAVALVMKRDPGPATTGVSVSAQTELSAGSLRGTEGAGEVRVSGLAATAGRVLRAGDVVEVEGAAPADGTAGTRALLERPRKVMWLLERGAADDAPVARARVKSAGESLVIGLENGAIEAQVTPVPSGEAFAVDVATGTSLVRVAVHGTHLRVSRKGTRVVVDLTEGVVSIGVPPRTGSTYGTLVTAPSHVEFDAANLDATLRIDHSPAAVRAAVPLVSNEPSQAVAARPDVPQNANAPQAPTAAAPGIPATVPRPESIPRPAAGPAPAEPVVRIDPLKPSVPARVAIAAAVRDCAAARSRPENVRVTVSSSLKLKIAAGGGVETAQFDPPLLPEIQTCAATAIYKATLEEAAGGTVTIPIDFSY